MYRGDREKIGDCFRRIEDNLFRESLNQIIAQRLIFVSVTEFCRLAKITRTTFYAHFSDPKAALDSYEGGMERKFFDGLPNEKMTSEALFTYLLAFVWRQRKYFTSALGAENMFLLVRILKRLKPQLARGMYLSRSYEVYCHNVAAQIWAWVVFDKCSRAKMADCAKKLARMRIMREE